MTTATTPTLEELRAVLAEAIATADEAPSVAEKMLLEPDIAFLQSAIHQAEQAAEARETAEAAARTRAPLRAAEDALEAVSREVVRAREERDTLAARRVDGAYEGARRAALARAEQRFVDALDREAEAKETLRLARGGAPAPIDTQPATERPPTELEAAEDVLAGLIIEETTIRQQLDAAKARRAKTGETRAEAGVDALQKKVGRIMERRLQAERRVDELSAATAQEPTHADAGANDWPALEAAAREAIAGDGEAVHNAARAMLATLDTLDRRLTDRRVEMAQATAGGERRRLPVEARRLAAAQHQQPADLGPHEISPRGDRATVAPRPGLTHPQQQQRRTTTWRTPYATSSPSAWASSPARARHPIPTTRTAGS